jgi:hypothetical protein
MMTNLKNNSRKIAQEIRQNLAERGLPPDFAKLYSQHTRLTYDQQGLLSWREEEMWQRLHDAIRLISAGLLEKEQGIESWSNSLRRAGELLEWLSHSQLNPDDLPLTLLSSAAYQLAGYPARAMGLLNAHELTNNRSRILHYFLKADFRSLQQSLVDFWSTSSFEPSIFPLPWHDQIALSERVQDWIAAETASSIGVICSFIRWGDETRILLAIQKLSAIADLLLHGTDPYSWLLAKLCAEIIQLYYETSTRMSLATLINEISDPGKKAIEVYLRYSYLSTKSLTWRSQKKGIDHLHLPVSFALCTPTGSGKTTVAEIAILQSLYREDQQSTEQASEASMDPQRQPIALYLVPSKALATEVERKLTKVLSQLRNEKVIVTGLYGGNDWGPTDAWLTSEERIVLICTYEKAEALMRFLGSLFLNRVSLIVIDEAHNIQYDGILATLVTGESRSLRLESLCVRLLAHTENTKCRILALSAVAVGIETLIANWITGTLDSAPVQTDYRSTRQLIGTLECSPTGKTEIKYDLLDNSNLKFQVDGRSDSPFIPNPFPICPIPKDWQYEGPDKRIRPHLLWAALHLARPDINGQPHAVLIFAIQNIGWYADDFLKFLKTEWMPSDIPDFFVIPTDRKKLELWQICLSSCEDYFTKDSREYELLERGIVLHHGKMPGLLARLLIQLIDEKIANIVIATSTLSEGVNLPFETVLIPSLLRSQKLIKTRDFRNLVGRAGRPGYGTEGRSLILLPAKIAEDPQSKEINAAHKRYTDLIRATTTGNITTLENKPQSPLAELLMKIYQAWRDISGSNSPDDFFDWLEQTTPIQDRVENKENTSLVEAINAVDSLDAILLATIVEIEQIEQVESDLTVLEENLQKIWQKTFARFAHERQSSLNKIFVKRGLALKSTIYPSKQRRRQLYRTSLPPADGDLLIQAYEQLLPYLHTGEGYANWKPEQQYQYIETIVGCIGELPHFIFAKKAGKRNVVWQDILKWWLSPTLVITKPKRDQISDWHSYVSQNFTYRFNWGLGSLISLAMDAAFDGKVYTPTLRDWPLSKLPWVIFWLKELITWGTLEPIAAYLLSRQIEKTRPNAEAKAQEYYRVYKNSDIGWNELLNATRIRQWVDGLAEFDQNQRVNRWFHRIQVELLRDFSTAAPKLWRVLPVMNNDKCRWFDPAGFPLAISHKIEDWSQEQLHEYDFWLNPEERVVTSEMYLS